MANKGLEMKSLIVTNNHVYDVNDKFLEAGRYYFIVESFTQNNTVIGNVVSLKNDIKNSQFEFRFFSLMTMMVKAQSYLARRVDKDLLSKSLEINSKNMPDYPSPKQYCNKRVSYLRKKNQKSQCMICLEEMDGYDFTVNKLKCGHKFHYRCLDEWKRHSKFCPVCRKEIPIVI